MPFAARNVASEVATEAVTEQIGPPSLLGGSTARKAMAFLPKDNCQEAAAVTPTVSPAVTPDGLRLSPPAAGPSSTVTPVTSQKDKGATAAEARHRYLGRSASVAGV